MTTLPRWGILGTGAIAKTTAVDLHATENLELTAVTSRTVGKAAAFAADFSVPHSFDDYRRLLAGEEVDVVYVCTPPSTHAPLAREALLAGKHVVVEKPFATNAADAREVAELAAERRLFLMEAMWMRFNPAICSMLAELADGVVGDPRTVTTSFGIPFPKTAGLNIWRPELGGGALLDLGVYGFTMAHLVLGAPVGLRATGDLQDDGLDVTESVFLDHGDGRFAQTLSSIGSFVNPVASIGGTRGFIAFDEPFMSSTTYRVVQPRAGEPRTVSLEREGNGYVPMFRAVSQAIQDGLTEQPLRPVASTIAVLDTMDEVRRQLRANQWRLSRNETP